MEQQVSATGDAPLDAEGDAMTETSPAPAAPKPDRQQLELEKLQLETVKLKAETEALTIRWWKRPAYLAAIFPTIIGLLTLAAGFLTGYIQAQYQLLQLRRERLEVEKGQYEQEQQRYKAEKFTLDAQVAELSKKQRLAEVTSFLDVIEEEAKEHRLAMGSLQPLARKLGSEPKGPFAEEVARRLGATDSILVRAQLLQLMYVGTGEQKWRDQVFALALDPGIQPAFWELFRVESLWHAHDRVPVLKLLGQVLPRADESDDDRVSVLTAASALSIKFPALAVEDFERPDEFFDILTNVRAIVLNSERPVYDRGQAFFVVARMAPEIAVAMLSELVHRNDSPSVLLTWALNELEDNRTRYSMGGAVAYPVSFDREVWRAWRDEHQQLVERAIEDNFATWRRSPKEYAATTRPAGRNPSSAPTVPATNESASR